VIQVRTNYMNFIIYFLFDLWTSLYDNEHFLIRMIQLVFGNFLALEASLMGYNVIFKCGKDSLMFQNSFLTRIPYHPSYTRKERLMVFNDRLVSRVIEHHCRL